MYKSERTGVIWPASQANGTAGVGGGGWRLQPKRMIAHLPYEQQLQALSPVNGILSPKATLWQRGGGGAGPSQPAARAETGGKAPAPESAQAQSLAQAGLGAAHSRCRSGVRWSRLSAPASGA